MPYKAIGNWVYVKHGGRWTRFKKMLSAAKAKAYAAALNIHAHKGK